MKILVTGGGGNFGKTFKKINSNKYITPNREELNLSDTKSILQFYNNNKDIDGIILGAKINTVEVWNNSSNDLYRNFLKPEFEKSYSENIYNNFYLTELYSSKLKFIIYMTSTFHYDKYFGYRVNKLAGEKFFLGLKTTDKFKHVDIKVVNPGHMDTELTYLEVCTKIDRFINDIDIDFIKNSDYFLLNNNGDDYVSYEEIKKYKTNK